VSYVVAAGPTESLADDSCGLCVNGTDHAGDCHVAAFQATASEPNQPPRPLTYEWTDSEDGRRASYAIAAHLALDAGDGSIDSVRRPVGHLQGNGRLRKCRLRTARSNTPWPTTVGIRCSRPWASSNGP
jgi:hypothetical protein